MRDVFVVTHPQSRHHVDGRVGGGYDTGLTELGFRQADAVAARLAELVAGSGSVALHASDLTRAVQTAERIGVRLGVPIRERSDLREISYGEAEGKPQAWLDERRVWPSDAERMDHRGGIVGAETRREFLTRVYGAMSTILADPARIQILVTHGFAMTFLVAAWIEMPPESAGWVDFKARPGGITHLRQDDGYRNRSVVRLDDLEHLRGV